VSLNDLNSKALPAGSLKNIVACSPACLSKRVYGSIINFMSFDFKSSAKEGDIIEIGIEVIKFGTASITLHVEVRNMMTKNTILTIEKIVMINLDSDGKPAPHGKTKIEFTKDRIVEK
jgi:acyl-CoA thioesterase YciA